MGHFAPFPVGSRRRQLWRGEGACGAVAGGSALVKRKNVKYLMTAGKPVWGATVKVVSTQPPYVELKENMIREVWTASASVVLGDWDREEATRDTFCAFLDSTGEGPFLRTGDLGFFNEGELFICGRLKDGNIIGSKNVSPQDIDVTAEHTAPQLRGGCSACFSLDSADWQEYEEKFAEVHQIKTVA